MMKRTAVAIALIAAFAGSAAAQTDADTKEIQSYTLTVSVLHKMIDASKAVYAAMQQDPQFRDCLAAEKELASLQDKDDPTPAEQQRIDALEKQTDACDQSQDSKSDDTASLSDMERTISSIPHMSDALRSAGVSPREFVTFEMCAMQAGIVAGLEQSGHPLAQLPAGIQPANVQFMKDHAKEFEDFGAAMQGGAAK